MKQRILIFIYRLIVLAIGWLLAEFVAFRLFPYIDQRAPAWVAVIAAYCFVAYVGLPALVRIWQLFHQPARVPTRTHASDGWALDPLNIAIAAKNESEFITAMSKAGWLLADPPTIKNQLRFLYSLVFNQPYPTAPFGTQYVFGRRQDLGFQIPVGNSVRHRHHVRFWRLGTTILEEETEHHGFWHRLFAKFLGVRKRELWVGAAILDTGINIRLRNLQLDHGIYGDTSYERDFLVDSLQKAHVLKDVVEIKAGKPLNTRHQGLRETIVADGYIKLCELKRQLIRRA